MLSYQVYKILHILGLLMTFGALAALVLDSMNGGTKEENTSRKLVMATHGGGLFLVLLGGFGMLARLGVVHGGLPPWVHVKLTIWVVVGALAALPYRKPGLARLFWFLFPCLGALGAYVALYKPFSG